MLKIGMIGLGDIAAKAYLPVLSMREGIDIHLSSRNREKLEVLGNKYRISNLHNDLDSLMASGIKAAFVHSSTLSHFEIVKKLLENGVHVFVDKPITLDEPSAAILFDIAKANNLILMVGFNRRYAPVYRELHGMKDITLIIMQKNRQALPCDLRTFIFDDFIHVVDTLCYLFPHPIEHLRVNGIRKNDTLHQVVIQYIAANGATAIGVMNRDTGTTEERVEVFNADEKRVVTNVSEISIQTNGNASILGADNWEPTLHKRGFYQMADDFLDAVSNGITPEVTAVQAMSTQRICEQIVQMLQSEQ